VSKDKSFFLKKMGASEAFKLLRLILSGMAAENRDLTVEEEVIATLLMERCETERDPSFIRKWRGRVGETLSNLLLWSRKALKFNPPYMMEAVFLYQRMGILVTPCAYFGWARSVDLKDLIGTQIRQRNPRPRPKRFMGVGYADSGTARDTAYDASPRWQEVYSSLRRFLKLGPLHDEYLERQNDLLQSHDGKGSIEIIL
jgi:hypothetical protein